MNMTPRQLAEKLEREYGRDADISYLMIDNTDPARKGALTVLFREPARTR
jgi:hypothetical protein